MAKRRSITARAQAFSLVELLVVISIIALIIAIVVPAMAHARRSAKVSVCLTQVKGLMTAVHAYAVENDGNIPYGPAAPPQGVNNFYAVTGMVTSQISLLNTGQPVGLGLALAHHLGHNADILFCPGTDEPVDAKKELSKVGKTQAVSSYYYRHGSNTLLTVRQPRHTWDDHIRLANLGLNSQGKKIRALIVDQNFLTDISLTAFGIINRTNHHQRQVNVGYSDGHAETQMNVDKTFSVNAGRFPYNAPDKMLGIFEKLDAR